MPGHTDSDRHSKSYHKRSESGSGREHTSTFIKPEPPSEDERRSSGRSHDHRHHSSRGMSKRGSSRSPRGGRLNAPVIIKEEEGRKRRRLHSPVVLPDDDQRRRDDRRAEPDFSRSGLLDQTSRAPVQRQTANFGLSGKLTEDTNTYKGVVIKYNEPPDARKPTEHWRLYQFKGNECLPILHIHRQSGFLIGRDRKIADIPMDHPSISKQHAVLQYRFVRGLVRLYVIDLESANGTYLNNKRIEPRRYYELLQKDVIKFGYSSREYVVMTANLDEDEMGTPEEAA
ncbi:hypothetical protein T265_00681 [Opisthorchis viverrini]|uniref:FHA domain-containing protein n=2 Tax=Opisthorchis viverrini TaxID=6198 RepID=A0A075ABW9_OPIVI|nr:hypothetical protein T265_00681 [Opisthorchis viverrini]KER33355.1 hypothetical protein T265_00681 [Opisthorchis viverrini]